MSDEVKCPRCGAVIGDLVNLEGTELLQIGNAICREWHGVCAACGYGLHWSVSERLLAHLLDRVLKNRE